MSFFIDTHAHTYLPEFDNDREEVIRNSVHNKVQKILMPNIDSSSVDIMNQVARQFPGICYPMMGLHPTSVKGNYKEELAVIEQELKKPQYIAVGETGIDLYWDKTWIKEQEEAFRTQIELSLLHDLPLVIHARESFPEILNILTDYTRRGVRGVFHAFTGDSETAEKIIDMGFYFGIGGIITYRKSDLPVTVSNIPIERILLETDSPYLPPVPYRGKRNESSYIPVIAQHIQNIKNLPLDEVAEVTTKNALELFRM